MTVLPRFSRRTLRTTSCPRRGRRRELVGVERVHLPDLTQGPPHLLYDLHLLERGAQGLGSDAHRIHDDLTRSLGSAPRLLAGDAHGLSGFAQPFLPLPSGFERLAIPVALFAHFLCPSPTLFRLITGKVRGCLCFRKPTVPLGVLAVVGIRAHWARLLASPMRRNVVV